MNTKLCKECKLPLYKHTVGQLRRCAEYHRLRQSVANYTTTNKQREQEEIKRLEQELENNATS